MKIFTDSSFLSDNGIKIVEQKMNAKYVFESCVRNRDGGWVNLPVAIFYTETAHPQGSNYFGLYQNFEGKTMIIDAISATEDFQGIMIDNEVIYSRYRHDFREHNGVFVDGGRDYIRCGGERYADAQLVGLRVIKDKLEIV